MYLKKLKLDNFTKFKEFELVFDKKITKLIGINGSGKTTLGLTAIWACLKGICENKKKGVLIGNRYKFIGDNDSKAKIQIIIVDEKENAQITVTRTIHKKSNKITFKAPDDYPITENWLSSLLNVHFLSSKQFCELSGKEQAIALGIDTVSQDKKIKELKEEAKLYRYDIKSLGNLEDQKVEQAQLVSISKLIEKKDKATAFNTIQANRAKIVEDVVAKLFEKQNKLDELKKEIALLEDDIKKGDEWVQNCPKLKEDKDIKAINKEILDAEANNAKALLYNEYVKKRITFDEKRKKLNDNLAMQESYKEEKFEIIKHHDFGIKGLSIDDDGKLLLNDREIRPPYYSRGELEVIIAKFFLASDPQLKLRFFDDFESIDEDNQAKLLKLFLDKGFQVIIAEVGDMKKGKNDILLKEKI